VQRFDRDQLLALGLAQVRKLPSAAGQTGAEIVASARAARARAVETRKRLSESRERSRAAFAIAMKSRQRLESAQDDREPDPPK
jgi:hypothetical protein